MAELTDSAGSYQPDRSSRGVAALSGIAFPVVVFVASRLAVMVALVASGWLAPSLRLRAVLGSGWDAGWNLQVAQFGYPHELVGNVIGSRWVFFPAYPAAVRAVVAATSLSYVDASTLLAAIFGLTAVVAVWLAARELAGDRVARRSAVLFAFFPAAYVLSMGYAEGLFVTATALCLYALSRRWWVAAGCAAAVASLSRSMGVVAVAAVVAAVAVEIARRRRLRPVLGAVAAPLGLVGWLAFSWARAGTPFAFVRAERYWQGGHFVWFTAPFVSLGHVLGSLHGFRVAADDIGAITVLYVVVGALALARGLQLGDRLPIEWWVVLVGGTLVAFTSYWSSSTLRFIWVVFPFQVVLARRLSDRWTPTLAGLCAMGQGVLAVVVFVGLSHWQTAPLSP